MKRVILNGVHRPLERYYATLKHFVGENRVYSLGDILFVSTRNNEDYDVVLYPDGKKTFLQLWADKDKQPGGGGLGPNTVGTEEIIDGSVQMEDLHDDVVEKIQKTYVEDDETMHMDFDVRYASTQPSTPSAPIVVEEEEEP